MIIIPSNQISCIDQLQSMGYPRFRAFAVVHHCLKQNLQSSDGMIDISEGLEWLSFFSDDLTEITSLELKPVLFCTEEQRQLIHGSGSAFIIHPEAETIVKKLIEHYNISNKCSLQAMTYNELSLILRTIIPRNILESVEVPWCLESKKEKQDNTEEKSGTDSTIIPSPGSSYHIPNLLWFSSSWLVLLWKHLQSCKDLSLFSGFPIVPTTIPSVYRFYRNSSIVSGEALNDGIRIALSSIGLRFLDTEIMSQVRVPNDFWYFVHPPTPEGILSAILATSVSTRAKNIASMFDPINKDTRIQLLIFLLDQPQSFFAEMPANLLEILRELPIFPRYPQPNQDDLLPQELSLELVIMQPLPVSLEIQIFIPPSNTDPNLLGPSFLWLPQDFPHNALRALQTSFGIAKLSTSQFLRSNILPRTSSTHLQPLPDGVRDSAMIHYLRLLPQLTETEDKNLWQAFGSCEFVPTMAGGLVVPPQLFDPDCEELRGLVNLNRFPADSFSDKDVLSVLRRLGMKNHLDKNAVLDR